MEDESWRRSRGGEIMDGSGGIWKHLDASGTHLAPTILFFPYLNTLNRRLRMHAVQHDKQQGVTVQAGTRHQPK